MEVQPQLVLLQKTLLNIGVSAACCTRSSTCGAPCRSAERWMSEQVGPRAFIRRVRETLPQISEDLPEVPLLVHRVLRKAVDGDLKIQWQSEQLEQVRDEIRVAATAAPRPRWPAVRVTLAATLSVGLIEPAVLGFNPLWLGAGCGGVGLLLLAWASAARRTSLGDYAMGNSLQDQLSRRA